MWHFTERQSSIHPFIHFIYDPVPPNPSIFITPLSITTQDSNTRPTPLPIRPNTPAPPRKQKRHRHQNDGHAAENRVAPADADVVIHGPHEEGEGAREHGAQEHVGRDGAGAVAGEGVDEVVEG